MPAGLTATYSYDEAGQATALDYTKSNGFWPSSTAAYNIHGQQTNTLSGLNRYAYTYDAAARLTKTNDMGLVSCTVREYSFDANTNRTQLVSRPGNFLAPCPTTGGTTTNHTYDNADRITDTGYTYDAFGRTLTIPAAQNPSGNQATAGYYVNDLARTLTQNSVTTTYHLDPNRRVRTWTNSSDSDTRTHHYTGDTDIPAWTAETTSGSTYTRNIAGFRGLAAIQTNVSGTNTIRLQLTNLHGDLIASAATTDTTWDYTWTQTDEYGRSNSGGIGARYDYLGTHQRQRDDNTGIQLMGVRLYNPTSGRFLQEDPVVGGSANAYEYCVSDPTNCTDLGGRASTGGTWNTRGWYFNTGNITATLYFSPKFTRWFKKQVDYGTAGSIESAFIVACAGLAGVLAGVIGLWSVAVAMICSFAVLYYFGDFKYNVRQAIDRSPDGCLVLKFWWPGFFVHPTAFDDRAHDNKYCKRAAERDR